MNPSTVSETRNAEDLAAVDRELILHPYLARATQERVIMTEGDGCTLRDVAGREYLDATGGLWLAQVGHGRHDLAEVAARQMETLEFFMSFWEFSNQRAIELAERLVAISPDPLRHVFFTNGGSEGNEAAIKLSRYAHYQRGDKNRTWILARHQGYHGVGYGSGTATGLFNHHDGVGPMLPHVEHLTPPWPYRTELYNGEDPTDYCIAELENTIARLGPDNIAAFIGEPVMGVAGMVIPPDDYWTRVQEVLRANGITFIFDEVVTAFGRTGHWFAADRFKVEPDIIVTAKGITSGYLPLGAVLMTDEIFDAVSSEGFQMGFTYNGHPTTTAVALANLEVIESENLLQRAQETGKYMLDRLRDELADVPIVGEVRGLGMMHAVELVRDRDTRSPLPMITALEDVIRQEHGVIVRDCQHNVVTSPPLVMTRAEVDQVVAAMRSVLSRIDSDGHLQPAS